MENEFAIRIENLVKIYVTECKKGLFKSELNEVQALKAIDLEIPNPSDAK
ncbi:MAG: hypothetical protein ACFFD4_32385 [Candidatus Odinarchaeota archaeon]